MILYVTLHARKVTIEERKQLATTRVTCSVVSQAIFLWSEADGCLHSHFK